MKKIILKIAIVFSTIFYIFGFTSLAAEQSNTDQITVEQLQPEYLQVQLNHGKKLYYKPQLHGENGATLNIERALIERDKRSTRFVVVGPLVAKSQNSPGVSTFYAEFYNQDARLLDRQATFTHDPSLDGGYIMVEWIVPSDCTGIVLN